MTLIPYLLGSARRPRDDGVTMLSVTLPSSMTYHDRV